MAGGTCGQLRRPQAGRGRGLRQGSISAGCSSLADASGATIRSLRSQVAPPYAPCARRSLGSPWRKPRPLPACGLTASLRLPHATRCELALVAGSGRLARNTRPASRGRPASRAPGPDGCPVAVAGYRVRRGVVAGSRCNLRVLASLLALARFWLGRGAREVLAGNTWWGSAFLALRQRAFPAIWLRRGRRTGWRCSFRRMSSCSLGSSLVSCGNRSFAPENPTFAGGGACSTGLRRLSCPLFTAGRGPVTLRGAVPGLVRGLWRL